MARFRRTFGLGISLPLAAFLAAVPSIASASVGFYGPIIPQSGSCACNGLPLDWGCVLQVIQNLVQLAVSLGVVLCVLWIAYAGFSLMVSGGNPEARSQGKTRVTNAAVGILVILCSWLIVDFVMKTLYEPNTALDGGVFGPWNSILASNGSDFCIQPHTPIAITAGSLITGLVQAPSSSGSDVGGDGGVPGPSTKGSCTPDSLTQAGWPPNLASQMSCVTKYENASCNPSAPSGTDIGSDGRSVSIGLFQVNISANNLNYPACEALNGGQPLNCTQAFAGGSYTASNHSTHVAPGKVDLYNTCRAAASNPSCNTAAAVVIRQKQGIGAWGTPAQRNCGG